MKKFLSFILIFVIVFSFSGCSYIFASKLDSNQADVIECPNFVGMTIEEYAIDGAYPTRGSES